MTPVAYVEPDLFDTLDAVHRDWRPTRVEARRILREAIHRCADAHAGRVHIAWFRADLPQWIDPHQIGAAVAAWAARGHLHWTGEYLPNGGPSGNGGKPAKVYRLVSAIPVVDADG